MAYQGVLVIHRADQDEYEPLDVHQEGDGGLGWWDIRKDSGLPSRVSVASLPDDYLVSVLCLPDSQVIFRSEEWSDEAWKGLVHHFLSLYPEHLGSVIACHS